MPSGFRAARTPSLSPETGNNGSPNISPRREGDPCGSPALLQDRLLTHFCRTIFYFCLNRLGNTRIVISPVCNRVGRARPFWHIPAAGRRVGRGILIKIEAKPVSNGSYLTTVKG